MTKTTSLHQWSSCQSEARASSLWRTKIKFSPSSWAAAIILTSSLLFHQSLSQQIAPASSISKPTNNNDNSSNNDNSHHHQIYSENSQAHRETQATDKPAEWSYPRAQDHSKSSHVEEPRSRVVELSDNAVYLLQQPGEELAKLTYQLAPEISKESISTSAQRNTDDNLLWLSDLMVDMSPGDGPTATGGNSLDGSQQTQWNSSSQAAGRLPLNLQLITKARSPSRPVLDRWSGWHDMSVDPDLAASDHGPYVAVVAPNAPIAVTTYRAADQQALFAPMSAAKEVSIEQEVSRATKPMGVNERSMLHAASESSNWPVSELEGRMSPMSGQFSIKRVQVTKSSGASSSGRQWSVAPSSKKRKKSTKLALNLISPNNLIKMQHSTEQQQPSQQPAAADQSPARLENQPQQVKQEQQQQQRRRFKRRRKSKTNAEVRIQQLVAADQQLQQQRQLDRPNQVNSLALGHLDWDQAATPVEGSATSVKLPLDGHQVVSLRRVPQVAPQMMAGKRPPVIVKRMGATPVSVADGNSTHPVKRRTVRRRRLKTLLPVGLTSWFLGGIRDLDGRHWHLSSDLMSKLAINDVDFHPSTGRPEAPTSSPNKPEFLAADQQPQSAWPALERLAPGEPEVKNRPPSNKLVPR